MQQQQRQFIRHPLEIPIKMASNSHSSNACLLKNVSLGGLCIQYPTEFSKGDKVNICIPLSEPEITLEAIVCWCRKVREQFEVGVYFITTQDAFTARMVEQMCHIESYRQAQEKETGRPISSEQAASEWIGMYASTFPKL
jgi:Tfp pilus assembly protein PilZ